MSAGPSFAPHDASDDAVLRYLHGQSAHSDVVERLWLAVRHLPGALLHCPDPARYAWVLAHDAGRVFAFAIGMHGIGVRLPATLVDAARAEGVEPIIELDGWWLLRLFDGPSLAERSGYWVAHAHANLRARDGAAA